MTDQGGKGVEIVDSNVSVSASATTQPTDKNQVNVNTGAEQEETVPAPDAGKQKVEPAEAKGPYDEEGGVPRHVDPHPDDVSSLQHSAGGKPGAYAPREEPIAEESYIADEDEEAAKALRRRNMLIIIMLLLFLGLVVAIGVGVGLAVKNNPNPEGSQPPESSEGGTTVTDDDEYGGLGGGVEVDDQFVASATPSAAPSNSGPCIPVEIGIIFDEYSDETGWLLVKGNYYPEDPDKNDIVWESKYYKPLEYSGRADTFHRCFPPGYYTFVFTDKEGDGICCYHGEGAYTLSSEGKMIKIGGEMDSQQESIGFELPFEEPEPVDTNGDGVDDRLGWIMPYDSSNYTEGVDCENFRLVVLTDEYGIETDWELYEGSDKSGKLIANGGPYASQYTYVVDYCLESPKRYALYMYDWARDGLCCESGEGMYKVSSGDIVIHDSDGKFGEVNITKFILPADGSVVIADPTQSPTFGPGVKTAYPTAAPKTPPPIPPFLPPRTPPPSKSPTLAPDEVDRVEPVK